MDVPAPALSDLLDGPSRWHTLDHHARVSSTNDLAAAASRDGVPPGLVVAADVQTAGRGRRGRVWEDRPDGASLAVSVTIAPPTDRSLVPLAAGLAVVEALHVLGVEATLKWPNDVLVEGRKVAGVLAEAHADVVVIGIGTNVDLRDAPIEGATSVAHELSEDGAGDRVDRWAVLAAELRALERWLDPLDRGEPGSVVDAYRRGCSTIGRDVRVDLAGGSTVRGRAVDVTAAGALVVERADGGAVEVVAGDVHHVRPA